MLPLFIPEQPKSCVKSLPSWGICTATHFKPNILSWAPRLLQQLALTSTSHWLPIGLHLVDPSPQPRPFLCPYFRFKDPQNLSLGKALRGHLASIPHHGGLLSSPPTGGQPAAGPVLPVPGKLPVISQECWEEVLPPGSFPAPSMMVLPPLLMIALQCLKSVIHIPLKNSLS